MSLNILSKPRHVARGPERRVPMLSPGTGSSRLFRTHWVLPVCVVCGHERPHDEQQHATCPNCGAQLRSFALYRDLRAGQ